MSIAFTPETTEGHRGQKQKVHRLLCLEWLKSVQVDQGWDGVGVALQEKDTKHGELQSLLAEG